MWLYFKSGKYNFFIEEIELQKSQALRLLGLDIFSRPYGYLQPYVY